MGFRISLYCISKETANKFKDITEEEYDYEGVVEELEKERIAYDVLTNIILDDVDNKCSSRFFTNRLSVEDDMLFRTISKEQMLNIIEKVRESNANWYWDRRVILKSNGETELGALWSDPEGYYEGSVNAEEAMKKNQREWNNKAGKWKTVWKDDNKVSYPDINIDLNNKWLISGSWNYEYFIFDLIHIYKIFDWENNILFVSGG